MEEKNDEYLEDQNKTQIIGTDQTIMLEEALVNPLSKQVMKKYPNHDYKILQSHDYGSYKFVMSEQFFF